MKKDRSRIGGKGQLNNPLTALSGLLILLLTSCGGQAPVQVSQTSTPISTNNTAAASSEPHAPMSNENTALPPVKAAVGGTAPDFKASDLLGQTIQLSFLRGQGKAIVLNYWSVYCEPCRQEAPELVKTFETNKSRLTLVGIDINDETDEVRNFVSEFKIQYPIIIDNTGDLIYKYRIVGRPATVFINKEGIITGIKMGLITPQTLEQELAKAIK